MAWGCHGLWSSDYVEHGHSYGLGTDALPTSSQALEQLLCGGYLKIGH